MQLVRGVRVWRLHTEGELVLCGRVTAARRQADGEGNSDGGGSPPLAGRPEGCQLWVLLLGLGSCPAAGAIPHRLRGCAGGHWLPSSQWSGAVREEAELLPGLVRLPGSCFPESLSQGWSDWLSLCLLGREPVMEGAHLCPPLLSWAA